LTIFLISWNLLLIPDSNNHIQDVLVVSYLANTIRTQIDLSNRLATAALTMGSGDAPAGDGQKDGGDRKQGGDRRGGGKGRQQRQQEA
jgi:translation initiation factor 3 subunit F